jgi:hypothetical protein
VIAGLVFIRSNAGLLMHSPIVSLLGPKNRLGWAISYAILVLGVVMADCETPLGTLMQRAETALMRAKSRGRAQVMTNEEQRAA